MARNHELDLQSCYVGHATILLQLLSKRGHAPQRCADLPVVDWPVWVEERECVEFIAPRVKNNSKQ